MAQRELKKVLHQVPFTLCAPGRPGCLQEDCTTAPLGISARRQGLPLAILIVQLTARVDVWVFLNVGKGPERVCSMTSVSVLCTCMRKLLNHSLRCRSAVDDQPGQGLRHASDSGSDWPLSCATVVHNRARPCHHTMPPPTKTGYFSRHGGHGSSKLVCGLTVALTRLGRRSVQAFPQFRPAFCVLQATHQPSATRSAQSKCAQQEASIQAV